MVLADTVGQFHVVTWVIVRGTAGRVRHLARCS